MPDHLREVEDAAAREGVSAFQTQMEVLVLSLLDEDRGAALLQIEEARAVSLDYVRNSGFAAFSIEHEAKAGRVAVAMLEHSFSRLRIVIESPDEDEPPGQPVN